MSRQERPGFFDAGAETLFGIVTAPPADADPAETSMTILPGGGQLTSTHRNRLSVKLCRNAAGAGYHALRFDYHGVGESTGTIRLYRMDDPMTEDVKGAVRWLEELGIRRHVLVGTCMGARGALHGAAEIDGVEAAVLVAAPLSGLQQGEGGATRRASELGAWALVRRAARPRVLRRFFPPYSFRKQLRVVRRHLRALLRALRSRVRGRLGGGGVPAPDISTHFVETLQGAVRRGVRLLFVYGTDDPFYRDFERARSGPLRPVFERAGSRVQVRIMEGVVNPTHEVEAQERLVDLLCGWLSEHRAGSEAAAAG